MSKVVINESTLTAIGDAIRAKTGKSDLLAPGAMPTEIESIEAGGGSGGVELPPEAYVITGDASYRFANEGWDWFLQLMSDKLTTKDITAAGYMFQDSSISEIPFVLNFNPNNTKHSGNHMFNGCTNLAYIAGIVGYKPEDIGNMFSNCQGLRYLPENFVNNIDWTYFSSQTGKYNSYADTMFQYCYSLREIPSELFDKLTKYTDATGSIYYNGFYYCYALGELTNLPCYENATWTSNAFRNTFNQCYRLKRIVFRTNPDGTPVQVNWKNQTIDLTKSTGYEFSSYLTTASDTWSESEAKYAFERTSFSRNNSGITFDKMIYNQETYERLKDDPDAFVMNGGVDSYKYARYNRTSAIETINSLPKTTSTGCTIKFKGAAGSGTDGGAINTLTEEEIAVATAKGWTVTFA